RARGSSLIVQSRTASCSPTYGRSPIASPTQTASSASWPTAPPRCSDRPHCIDGRRGAGPPRFGGGRGWGPAREAIAQQAMGWEEELEELARRRAMAEAMGGPEKVERQH